jgi:hypothetical protein
MSLHTNPPCLTESSTEISTCDVDLVEVPAVVVTVGDAVVMVGGVLVMVGGTVVMVGGVLVMVGSLLVTVGGVLVTVGGAVITLDIGVLEVTTVLVAGIGVALVLGSAYTTKVSKLIGPLPTASIVRVCCWGWFPRK